MLRLTRVLDADASGGTAAAERANAGGSQAGLLPYLSLTWDQRVKSRLALMLDDGEAVAIMLPRGTVLRDGALLAGDDGRCVRIVAAPQPLLRITASAPLALLRAVYHLANRHVAAQIAPDHALIERDPVLAAMLHRLGAIVTEVDGPFDPEPGAYGAHGAHAAHTHRSTGHGDGEPVDPASASLGEQLSIEAHRRAAADAQPAAARHS